MSQESTTLEQLQNWMQAVVTHPDGVPAGVASQQARRNISVAFGALENVVKSSHDLSAAERLAIYGRAYHTRLMECLRTEYPCLQHMLGGEAFDQFALQYLQTYPPYSYTLYDLSDRFPRYLTETRPDANLPPEERESWPDFLIDLATLERAHNEVYAASGVEGETIMRAADIKSLSPKQLQQVHLEPTPCLRLHSFRYPVHQYFLAVHREEEPALPEAVETHIAITRVNYIVQLFELSSVQIMLLRTLTQQHTLADAVQEIDQDAERFLTDAQQWLCEWAEHGFFLRVD